MKPQIHPLADVQSSQIGDDTRIWQFAVVLAGAKIGQGCNLCAHTFVENDVVVGDRVTIKSGVYLWDGIQLDDEVFVGPGVVFTNDKYPRSQQYPDTFDCTHICRGASIGGGATIVGGITIGENAMIGAGSVVTKDVPAGELWFGNPATFRRPAPQTDRSIGRDDRLES